MPVPLNAALVYKCLGYELMLKKIKLLTYYFHFSRLKIERDFPKENPYKKALSALYWLISYVLIAALAVTFISFDIDAQKLREIWPYDYGREHSKNFIAPGVVIGIVILFFVRRVFVKNFLNDSTIAEIGQYYKKDGIDKKEHNYLINIDTLLFYAITAFIGMQLWIGVVLCFSFFAGQEVWIRKRFS